MIEIEKPTIKCEYSDEDQNYGRFIVEPLEPVSYTHLDVYKRQSESKRLQRREQKLVRRKRKLRYGHQRTADFPGNRV